MKATTPLFLFAAVAFAQDLSGVPECGRKCVNNMFAKAQELGCDADDNACLCNAADFGNGLHDCTVEACPDGQLAAVESAAAAMCPNGGSSPSGSGTSGGEEPTPSLTDSVIPPSSETGTDGTGAPTGATTGSATATGTGSESAPTGGESGGAGASTPYTTQPVVSTVTNDGKAQETTVGSTTLYTQAAGGNNGTTGTGTGTGTGTNTGGASEPTKTGGNGNGNGGSETGGNGSGSKPTGTGSGGSGSGGNGNGQGSGGDSTGTESGAGATSTGAAQALATHAGSVVGAVGLAAFFAL